MGVDAVWVCFTCNTYHYPGYRDILSDDFKRKVSKGLFKPSNIEELANKMIDVFNSYKQGSMVMYASQLLLDLATWLKNHEEHEIHITNDHDEGVEWYNEG